MGHDTMGPRPNTYNPNSVQYFVLGTQSGVNSVGFTCTAIDIDELQLWQVVLSAQDIWFLYFESWSQM